MYTTITNHNQFCNFFPQNLTRFLSLQFMSSAVCSTPPIFDAQIFSMPMNLLTTGRTF